MKKHTIIISLFLILILSFLIIAPEVSINACLTGINVWATNILPALFPFFFFTKILSELGFISQISKSVAPITKKLYNTSGISSYVYLMSIFSGYPVGAKITSDLYENNLISIGEAHRIVTFTSTSGPLFIIGTVAVGMFENKTLGYVVLISHFLGALLNGLLYRKYMLQPNQNNTSQLQNSKKANDILGECMISSIKSIVVVGGYISIFFMLITIFKNFNFFFPITFVINKICPTLPLNVISSILSGIIELTRGCLDLSLCGLTSKQFAMILSALISFGGISINLQALNFLTKMKIILKFYFLQKITHTIVSAIIAFVLGFLFL